MQLRRAFNGSRVTETAENYARARASLFDRPARLRPADGPAEGRSSGGGRPTLAGMALARSEDLTSCRTCWRRASVRSRASTLALCRGFTDTEARAGRAAWQGETR